MGEEIAAQNLATVFHTDDLITLDLPYFHAFRGEAMHLMAAKQVKTVMSIEYTSVSPQFGERPDGFQKAGWDLDICLGFKGDMKKHPDPRYRKIVEQIWENKIDYSDSASNKSLFSVTSE